MPSLKGENKYPIWLGSPSNLFRVRVFLFKQLERVLYSTIKIIIEKRVATFTIWEFEIIKKIVLLTSHLNVTNKDDPLDQP